MPLGKLARRQKELYVIRLAKSADLTPIGKKRFLRADNCILCNGREIEVLARKDRRGHPLTTVVCVQCGLISHLSRPSDEELSQYYAEKYRHEYHGERTPSPKRVMNAWQRGQDLYRRLRPFLKQSDRVLEVGAGIGCMTKVFQLAGHPVLGIEPGDGFSRYSREVLKAPVQHLRLEDIPRSAEYDVVLLVHVIEHFNDPGRALRHIHGLLRPGGRLYMECPNVGAPHAAPGKIFHYAHIHNFTHTTLTMLAQKCGLRVIEKLSEASERNIRLLLQRDNAEAPTIDPSSYEASVRAVNRYSSLSYHLRPSYLAGRLRTIGSRFGQRLFAKQRIEGIVQACSAESQNEGNK